MPKFVRYGLYALMALLVVSLFIGGRYQIELTNGYKLTRLNRERVAVTETGRGDYPIISGNVEQYAVGSPFIIGFASTNHMPADTNIVAGYFVVNTDSRVIKQGLTEDQWKAELAHIRWKGAQLQPVP